MFELESEGHCQEEKQDLRHLTTYVQIYIVDYFQNFSCLATYVYAKLSTHTHAHSEGRGP